MAQRGKKFRAVSALLNPRLQLSVLDGKFIHLDDIKDVPDSTPGPFCLRKQEADRRLSILQEKAQVWTQSRWKGLIIRGWVDSVTSDLRLTEKQLLRNTGFDDIGTLFFEFNWRLKVLGPGDALALLGVSLRHSLCRRTYSRRPTTAYKGPSKRISQRLLGKRTGGTETTDTVLPEQPGDVMPHLPSRPFNSQRWHSGSGDQDMQAKTQIISHWQPSTDRFGGRTQASTRAEFHRAHDSLPHRTRAVARQGPQTSTQHPHRVAHTYISTHRRKGLYGAAQSVEGATAQPPPHPIAESSFADPYIAKEEDITLSYIDCDLDVRPSHPTESCHHDSRTHHQGGSSRAAFSVGTAPSYGPQRNHNLPPGCDDAGSRISRRKAQQKVQQEEERKARAKTRDETEKTRREAERGLSHLPQAPSMLNQTAPKAIFDPSKHLPSRSLPKFTKKRKRDSSSPPPPGRRDAPCPPYSAPRSPSLESPVDTAGSPETATTLFDDERSLSSSPTVVGSVEEIKAQGHVEEVASGNAAPEHQDAAKGVASEAGDVTLPAFEPDDFVKPEMQLGLGVVEDASGERIGEPQVEGVSGTRPPEHPPKSRSSSSHIYTTNQVHPEDRDTAVQPGVHSPEEARFENSAPGVSLISSSDDAFVPSPVVPVPVIGTIPKTELEYIPPMQTSQVGIFPQLTDAEELNFMTRADDTLCLPFPMPKEDETRDLLLPDPSSTPPSIAAPLPPLLVPAAPASEIPAYRPLIPLHSYPPIWAETRQEVCETFEWFRSYQGGVYFSHDVVRGYLLSAFGAKRDIFAHDGRLIISHGGGRAESIHKEKGQSILRGAEDQRCDDKSVRALLKTFRERRPLALVIDDRYAQFPYDLASLGVTYAVLGFYMIVQAWAEVQLDPSSGRNIVKYKFAFQWCEGQGDPWWLSESGKPDIVDFDEDAPPVRVSEERPLADKRPSSILSSTCTKCQAESPQVYSQGWACLQPTCANFWRTVQDSAMASPSQAFLPEGLTYHDGFLQLREACPLPIGFETLRPPPVKERKDGVTTSHSFTRGFHCDKCGRLSCRVEWQRWKCNTKGCDKAYVVKAKVREAKELWSQPITSKYLTAELDPSSDVKRLPSRPFLDEAGNLVGLIDTFVLPEHRGFLHHIQPSGPHTRLEANDIFRTYQQQANDGSLPFKRWPMRAHKCRGALLTNYFSHNAGEPYHYVGGTDNTVPFDKAPSAVVNARALIRRRISQALSREADFNEVLTAAYMEKQKMAFHSDEEVGLGPLVAGLSLGSPAFMHFRLQRKHDKMGERKGILMSFILRHGDVFVMDGIGVQKYYEHTVVPTNFRIAATARSINAPTKTVQGLGALPKTKIEPVLTPLPQGPELLTMPELPSQWDA